MLLAATLVYLGTLTSSFQTPAQDPYPIWETDGISNNSLAARRARVMQEMGPGTFAVFFTNPERNRNNDVDFRFRPDSNFLYLTGFNEPDAALVLAPSGIEISGKKVTELLLLNDRNAGQETWTGIRLGPERASGVLGIQVAISNRKFSQVLDAIGKSGAQLCSLRNPPDLSGTVSTMASDLKTWWGDKEKKSGLASTLSKMRVVKSDEEITLLKKAIEASALGHCEVLKSCDATMRESDLQAIFEYTIGRKGCEYVGYPSIVGCGPSSTILHYESDRARLKAGDIVCMDAGGEYHGYSADVTRSFPVNGKFSKEQKEIYNIVLAAQDAGIAALKVGEPSSASSSPAAKVLADGLIKLGIIKSADELGRYYFHGIGHMIGLDVHDVGGGSLKPGMVMTVEPGIYIKAGSPCDPKYWNIGIRIEDDILITTAGPVNLSAMAPRKAEDIEKLMAQKGIGNISLTDK